MCTGVAKADELTVLSINPAHSSKQLEASPEIEFDWPKLTWLVSSEECEPMLWELIERPRKVVERFKRILT